VILIPYAEVQLDIADRKGYVVVIICYLGFGDASDVWCRAVIVAEHTCYMTEVVASCIECCHITLPVS
jgi:hypothetical protein